MVVTVHTNVEHFIVFRSVRLDDGVSAVNFLVVCGWTSLPLLPFLDVPCFLLIVSLFSNLVTLSLGDRVWMEIIWWNMFASLLLEEYIISYFDLMLLRIRFVVLVCFLTLLCGFIGSYASSISGLSIVLGFEIGSRVEIFRPKSISAGDFFVEGCGVERTISRCLFISALELFPSTMAVCQILRQCFMKDSASPLASGSSALWVG